ncbi:MAG TPA: phosphoadenylyl-sulfate reductase [Bryobacteraceae bacterium]|nr:phosphoadenylyl-sulfate reductase [Bryobacteraceae bacterium]
MNAVPELAELDRLEQADAAEILQWALAKFGRSLAIATAFQAEGMVILDIASRISPGVRVFTLDTGRLPEETYQMMETVRERYGVTVETVSPDAAEVESMVAVHGPNLFYREVPFRNLCCEIRKVRPLERKLRELDAWVTGLRRTHNDSRADVRKLETARGKLKLSPLADWSDEQVLAYIRQHDVPMHPLYKAGYRSIGCAPCTRAVQPGEDDRAGRWWWEQDAAKECGIHFTPDGKAERKLDVLLSEVLEARRA